MRRAKPATSAITIRLTGRAARWVRLLQDFGHLDSEAVDRLLIGIADLYPEATLPPGELIDLPVVRRAAAVILSANAAPLSPILEEDWPLLFA